METETGLCGAGWLQVVSLRRPQSDGHNGAAITGANSPSLMLYEAGAADDGAVFDVEVTLMDGPLLSGTSGQLTVPAYLKPSEQDRRNAHDHELCIARDQREEQITQTKYCQH